LTRARPRVAPHPFTTLKPHVGTLLLTRDSADDSIKLTIADLPGLIEGAAERNAGLGSQFLSLIEGCAMLLYLVDVGTFLADRGQASASEATDHFASQLDMLHNELALFNPDLVDPSRGCLVIGTKLDLVVPPSGAQATLDKLSAWLADAAKL
uniref:OBG-type G domain-containing protein n=1 Tax=Mesocestoides corti TaxID=53468 RepID=A0A5K3FD88_MESCO